MTTKHNATTTTDPQKPTTPESPSTTRVAGVRLVLSSLASLFLVGTLLYSYATSRHSGGNGAAAAANGSGALSWLSWHIKPFHPHHHGDVIFLTERLDDTTGTIIYKREFTVPCGDGVLVFNIGPALENQPYAYDMYQDNYAYSDNSGLCVLYPSYQGEQTADFPLWADGDATQVTIALGDVPTKISTRIVQMTKSKKFDNMTKRGGDFCIMRSGNFYTPEYYKQLKHEINTWPESLTEEEEISTALAQAVRRIDAKMERNASRTTATTTAVRGGVSQF